MSPALNLPVTETAPADTNGLSAAKIAAKAEARPTSILHRVPWRLPIAKSAEGPYYILEDGRKVIDGVGGAAVTSIGNGHPKVVQAIKDQVDKMSCKSIHLAWRC